MADQRSKLEDATQKLVSLQRRVGTDDIITQKEQEQKRLVENHASLREQHTLASKALSTQMELTKREKARAAELEARISDLTKKYDDSKKAYFKSKEERERLRQEVEKYKTEGVKESEVSPGTEIANKYEQIKIKYRVSAFPLYLKCDLRHLVAEIYIFLIITLPNLTTFDLSVVN